MTTTANGRYRGSSRTAGGTTGGVWAIPSHPSNAPGALWSREPSSVRESANLAGTYGGSIHQLNADMGAVNLKAWTNMAVLPLYGGVDAGATISSTSTQNLYATGAILRSPRATPVGKSPRTRPTP